MRNIIKANEKLRTPFTCICPSEADRAFVEMISGAILILKLPPPLMSCDADLELVRL